MASIYSRNCVTFADLEQVNFTLPHPNSSHSLVVHFLPQPLPPLLHIETFIDESSLTHYSVCGPYFGLFFESMKLFGHSIVFHAPSGGFQRVVKEAMGSEIDVILLSFNVPTLYPITRQSKAISFYDTGAVFANRIP